VGDINATVGFRINNGATAGTYLRGNGTRFVVASLNADDLGAGTVANAKLANSTISGVALGNNLNTLTMNTSGIGLAGSTTYNGSGATTFTVTSNATNANTASTIVARDASGNFNAGTISAALNGTATNATNINTETRTTNESGHLVFIGTTATGNVKPYTNTTLRVNPSTNTITATTFSGALNGNANTATSATTVTGTSGQLVRHDIRTIAPSAITAGRLQFGFTSYANNNTAPYADFLHLRSYTDSSGGSDNLVMFRKDAIAMRVYQQTFGSATAYSTFKDVAFTDSSITGTAANITATSNTTLTTLSNLVSIGTITTGTWNASTIAVNRGGTGATTLAANKLLIGNDTSAVFTNSNLHWDNTNSRLGIGTTSPGSNRLQVDGAARVTSLGVNTNDTTTGQISATANIIAYSSDKRLKTDIAPLHRALQQIQHLSGFTYRWNEIANQLAGFDTERRQVGVFAQDVQAVQPEAVHLAPFDNDGYNNSISGERYLTVQYDRLVPLLVEAIKELNTKIERLEKEK
jgi:hypothetical protein